MNGCIPKITAAAFALIMYSNTAVSEQRRCIAPSQQAPLEGNLNSKGTEFGLKMAKQKLSLEMVICDLGKPDSNIVLDNEFTSISGKTALVGERYVSYGDPRTDTLVNENALIFILNKDGFVRIMERYQPRKKLSWTLEIDRMTGKIHLSWGNYTQSISEGRRLTHYSGVDPL